MNNCSISTKSGDPTFMIKGGKLDNKKYKIDCEYKGTRPVRSIKSDGKVLLIPGKVRRADYIFGPAGVGKSWFAANNIIKPYKKKYPNRSFYLISPKRDDKIINEMNPNRIEINFDNFLGDDPLSLEEVEESIILFDDTEAIGDTALRKAVDGFRDQCLLRGRSLDISVVSIMHLHSSGWSTRVLILESYTITVFPGGGQVKGIRDILKVYGGLDSPTVENLLKINSRHITFHKRFPNWIATEKDFYLI